VIGPFVSRQQWRELSGEVVLADVRRDDAEPGRAAYDRGHLPGAVFVDLERVLSGPPGPQEGRHPLPSPEAFAEGMAQAGIGDDDTVVAYDDAGGVLAARLVWMLRVTGHPAALLDPGLQESDRTDVRPVSRPRRAFSVRPWPATALAGLADATDPGHVVLDARSRARYLGAPDPLDPRPGHVPGARSLPARDWLDGSGRLLPVDELRARLTAAGVTSGVEVVSGCGSGVTACHTLLVMEHVGLPGGRLWPGSWSQYAADPDRPVELVDPYA
jgi:thiosulfate/3-mercaptopyruvate sulfurtransferase